MRRLCESSLKDLHNQQTGQQSCFSWACGQQSFEQLGKYMVDGGSQISHCQISSTERSMDRKQKCHIWQWFKTGKFNMNWCLTLYIQIDTQRKYPCLVSQEGLESMTPKQQIDISRLQIQIPTKLARIQEKWPVLTKFTKIQHGSEAS